MMGKSVVSSILLAGSLSVSAVANATTFDFAAIADGDSSYGFTGGEFGAPLIIFSKDGLTLDATGAHVTTGAPYHAYLDSTWTHSGGGGAGGLGVCKVLSGDQCTPGSDDNVTIAENLTLAFDTRVTISETIFRNGEHNPTFDITAMFDLIIDGGPATQYSLVNIFTLDLTGTTFEFLNLNATDTDDFRFYISSMEVSAVPVPAAVWLFGSGLLGLVGVARRRRKNT